MGKNIIDTSFVFDSKNVVHTRTFDDAKALAKAIREQFPAWSDVDVDIRRVYGCWEQHEEETCFRFNCRNDGHICWGYCSYEYYLREGKNIIEFNDLISVADLGEIYCEYSDLNAAVAALF